MKNQTWKFLTIITATVAAGIPIWTVARRELNFTDPAFLAIWLSIGIFVSIIASVITTLKSKDLIGALTLGFAIAVTIRFIADMMMGGMGHGMLGLELLIAIGCGALSGWIGSLPYKYISKSASA